MISLQLPRRRTSKPPSEPADRGFEVIHAGGPPAVVAASQAFHWAGSALDLDVLNRLRRDWYPRVQHYLRHIGIFAAAARDVAQTIAEMRWSADDERFGESPTATTSPEWARLAESLSTLDWYRAAHQIYGPGAVHIAAWRDPDTIVRFGVYSLTELTPPVSGHPEDPPLVVDYEGAPPRPLWPVGTPKQDRPRIVTVFRPDGEYARSVWAPAQALLDDFEALLLMSIADKAYDLHRASGAGILFIPNSIAQVQGNGEQESGSLRNSPAIKDIVRMIQEPMANPHSLSRVVPAIITGPDDAGAKIEHILLERTVDPAGFQTRRDARWRSIAVALDQPAGRVINSEDQSKFYNAQQIDFMSMRATVAIAKIISSALMRDLFHPILRDQWHDKEWRLRTLTPSWDHLQPEPDRTDEALRLLEGGMVTLDYAQDLAKIPDTGRIKPGTDEWFLLLEWRRKLAGDSAIGGDLLGAPLPPAVGPAAPGTAPDGEGAPDAVDDYDPLADFDVGLTAAARIEAVRADLLRVQSQIAAKTAAAQDHSGGVMVSLTIPPDVARTIAVPGGEDPDDLHVTIAYLGKTADLDRATIEATLARVSGAPLEGTIGGIGRFPGSHIEGLQAVWVPVDVPGLSEFRNHVVAVLDGAGVAQGSEHGYTPHVTLDYVAPDQPSPPPVPSINVGWSSFTFVWDGERREYPLTGGSAAATAAASPEPAAQDHPLASTFAELNDIDRDTRARLAGAAEVAMRSAMRKVGVKLANRASASVRRVTAELASTPWLIPERLGPAACAAIVAAAGDDPLDGAFDDLADNAEEILTVALLGALASLRIDTTSTAGAAALSRAAAARAAAVDHLRSTMTTLARQRVYSPSDPASPRGEPVSGTVPAGIVSRTVAIAGGSPVETVDGATRLAASERPATGLATGPIVVETAATLEVEPFVVEYTWRAGNPAHPFEPHHELAGTTVRTTADSRLAVRAADDWLQVGHYHPMDHAGCRCFWAVDVRPA